MEGLVCLRQPLVDPLTVTQEAWRSGSLRPQPIVEHKLQQLQACSTREQRDARLKAMELATVPELPAVIAAQFAHLSMLPDCRRLS